MVNGHKKTGFVPGLQMYRKLLFLRETFWVDKKHLTKLFQNSIYQCNKKGCQTTAFFVMLISAID